VKLRRSGDDRGSRWRRQGGAEGGSPVVTGEMACVRETGRPVGTVKRPVQLTGGPRLHFITSMIFNHLNLKFKTVTFPMSKIDQIMQSDRLKDKE
jgi:hypothetical protein